MNAAANGMILLYLVVGAVVIVNLVSLGLFYWLRALVSSVSDTIGDETANLYASLLYNNLMAQGVGGAPKLVAADNADRDKVVRQVKASDQYQIIERIASWVRVLPVNFVNFK